MGNLDFALLLPYDGPETAGRMARTVCDRFREPWVLDNVSITPSAVVAEFIYTGQEESADDILEILNFSLSVAKGRKDRFLPFDPSIYERMAEHGRVMKLLQSALRENRFEAWYQPIYNCRTGRFTMAEALLRMRDNRGELVSPAVFIPIAEANGFIDEITDVVMDQACRLLADPAAAALEGVSVNLSAQQLLSEELIGKMDALLAQYRFDPGRLHLEVTERVLSENPQKMQAVMAELTKRGFYFCMDDFGTGQSNLSLVLENSFSCIKLDHSLIQGYPESERAAFIVNSMLDMFHGIHCRLIVEGVERESQASALIEHGVDCIQGFYYARPMPKSELLRLLAEG